MEPWANTAPKYCEKMRFADRGRESDESSRKALKGQGLYSFTEEKKLLLDSIKPCIFLNSFLFQLLLLE